jgi:hypothetical protein
MTIQQYIEITELERDTLNTQYMMDMVSIYYDIDPMEVEEYTIEKIIKLFQEIDVKIDTVSANEIKINKRQLYKLPFHKITLGEWIDLDYYIKENKIPECIAILYRLKINGDDVFEADKYEEYGLWVDKRKQLFLNVDAKKTVGVIQEFLNWRGGVIKAYSPLFITEETEEEDIDGLDPHTLREIEQAKQKEAKFRQFIWERMIMELVNNDISRFNEVLKLPVIQVWNILTMLKTTK